MQMYIPVDSSIVDSNDQKNDAERIENTITK